MVHTHAPHSFSHGYREVEVNVSTHAAGGLTKFDFVLAAKLDAIGVDYSPKWLKQQQVCVCVCVCARDCACTLIRGVCIGV